MSSTAAVPAAAVGPTRWIVAPTVALAAFMHVLDMSIINVALQHIAGSLSATREESTWVLTSYLVTGAIVLPASGWLASVFGRKRYYLASILGFGFTSLLCGLAPTLELLILFRALQGATSGGLQPVAQAIMADTFRPEERGTAMAIYGVAVVLAPAIGPTLGGWITDTFSWHWAFLINVPISIILYFLGNAVLEDPPELVAAREARLKAGISIDYLGFALLVTGFGCLQTVLDLGQQYDWFNSNLITIGAVIAALSLAAFVMWELARPDPIIDLRLLRNPTFAVSCLLIFVQGFAMMSSTALIPQYVQELLNYTATDAGMVLSPGGFMIMLVLPIVGRLITFVDPRKLIVFGLVVTGSAFYLNTRFNLEVDYWTIALTRMVQAGGMSFLFIPINTMAFIGQPSAKVNQASSLLNLSRNIGGSLGIAITVTMLARQTQVHHARLAEHVSPYSQPYVDMVAALQSRMTLEGGSAADALIKAQALIARIVEKQALQLAYIDVFLLLCVLFVSGAPLVLLMKRPPPLGRAVPRGEVGD